MFEAIKDRLATLRGRSVEADVPDERLALAALLVHVAAIDGLMLDSEALRLETLLADRFALGRSAARQLIGRAQATDAEAGDFSGFVASLKRQLGAPERARVVALMWEIARADGHVHEFEEVLIARVAELLEVATQ